MASSDPVVRYRHAQLPTQQRRLRHLRMIAVRNIVQHGYHGNMDISQIETYFTLHKTCQADAFYTSEKIRGSLNPTWRSFHLEHLGTSDSCDQSTWTASLCVVRIWRGPAEDTKLAIQWTVHLDGLVYLGNKARKEGPPFPPNTVLFGLMDGVYGCPSSPRSLDPGQSSLEVDAGALRDSYSTQTLLRIKTIMRAVKQTQASVQRVKHSIEQKLHHADMLETKRAEKEHQLVKNNLMRRDLDWRLRMCRAQKETYENIKTENQALEKLLTGRYGKLHEDRVHLHEKKKGYFDVREDLIKTGAQLVMRRKQLISELAFIYPIVEVSNKKNFTICGVRLPDSEDFLGQDEGMIAVALGYTSHLVVMIGHFLDVPLRYPMENLGSRSTIRDHIIDKLQDRERDFPLYSKGKEKFQFNYGVYLLNKNIAQMRYYCGLGTSDLRPTLSNLKSLLEFRLGVRFEATNAPVLAGQHTAVPPNLGGPQKTSPSFGRPQTNNVRNVLESPLSSRGSSCDKESDSSDTPTSSEKQLGRVQGDATVLPSDQSHGAHTLKSQSSQDLLHMQDSMKDSTAIARTLSQKDLASISKETQNTCIIPRPSLQSREVCISPSHGSPSIRTLDVISREKLMGAIANYDDLDVSSSEDSACATYASRFKMWPREQLDISQADQQWPQEDNDKINAPSNVEISSTFKTKAMTSPSKSSGHHGNMDTCDLLTIASEKQPNFVVDDTLKTSGVVPRQRTDSDTDAEESATFVIPNHKHSGLNMQIIEDS